MDRETEQQIQIMNHDFYVPVDPADMTICDSCQ